MKKSGEKLHRQEEAPDKPIDILTLEKEIGAAIRKRRLELGMTQEQLASKLGLSYQQIQKYETGLNRITAGRLFLISKILLTDLKYFFTEAEGKTPKSEEAIYKVPTVHLKGERMNADVQRAIANLVSTMAKNIH